MNKKERKTVWKGPEQSVGFGKGQSPKVHACALRVCSPPVKPSEGDTNPKSHLKFQKVLKMKTLL